MFDKIIIIVYVLLGVLVIQAFLLALVNRRILGAEHTRPIPATMVIYLLPNLRESLSENLKAYGNLLIGSTLIDFIRTARVFEGMSEEEHDSLDNHLDIWFKVLTEFATPVFIERIAKQVTTLEEYQQVAKEITDTITREIETKEYLSKDTQMVVSYAERIREPLDQVAELTITSINGMDETYLINLINNT